FVGPRPEGFLGLHFDDDAENDSLGNLRWGTAEDNASDRVFNNNPETARVSRDTSIIFPCCLTGALILDTRPGSLDGTNCPHEAEHPERCIDCMITTLAPELALRGKLSGVKVSRAW